LNPQFVALQESVAATGVRFTLMSDGSLTDAQNEGIAVAGLNGKDGKWTLQLADETIVALDNTAVHLDDTNGYSVDGYTYDASAKVWAKAAESVVLPEIDFEISSDTGVVTAEISGLQVSSQILTAANLDGKGIGSVLLNEGKNRPKWSKEYSEHALNEFTLGVLHEVWRAKGGVDGTGPIDKSIDADAYAAMIVSGPSMDTQITLSNVYEMGSDVAIPKLVIAPFAPQGRDVGDARLITNVVYSFVNATRTDNMTVTGQSNGTSLKVIVNGNSLYILMGLDKYGGDPATSATAGSLTDLMGSIPAFLKGRISYHSNYDLLKTIRSEDSNSCLSSAIQIRNGQGKMSQEEEKCNP